jgi:hypothetical protein
MNFTQNLNQLDTDETSLTGYYQAQQKLSWTLYSKLEPAQHWWDLTGYYQA